MKVLYIRVKLFEGSGHSEGSNTIGEFHLTTVSNSSIFNENWRLATDEEMDWYENGMKFVPKFRQGETVIIATLADDISIPPELINTVGKVTELVPDSAKNSYSYLIKGWWFKEEYLKAPVSEKFDRNNFLIYYQNNIDSIDEFSAICRREGIPCSTSWGGRDKNYYGVIDGKYIWLTPDEFSRKLNIPIPILYSEFKQFIDNTKANNYEEETNDVSGQIETNSRPIRGRVYKQERINSTVTSASRLVGNSFRTRRGKSITRESEKLTKSVYSSSC